jgi:hypothetical protein
MAEPSADEWFTARRFGVLLGLLIIVSFPQVVTGLEAFVYMDSGQFAYPVAFYHRTSFWHGEVPLWNPLNNCGIPFLAQWNTLTLYPLSLFYLLLPLPWSFEMFCLGHLFLAGLGMYFLAHRWTGTRLGAAVAGVSFAFNGLTWYGLMWPHIIAALAWMPWVVLAMEWAWRQGGRVIIVAALAAAMQMLSGGAEVIILTWFLLGVLWVAQCLRGETPRWNLAGRTLAIGCLVAGLTAAQMLPFLHLLAHSERNAEYGRASAGILAMPLTGWANYLVPLFRCIRNPQGVFLQANQLWIGSYYLGVGIVVLALLAVWRVRNQRVWFLTGVALLGLLLSLGNQGLVYAWLRHLIPMLGLIRFPVKFVILATFAVPLLAAFGLRWFQALPAGSWPKEWKKTKYLALILIGMMGIILWFAWKYPLPGEDIAATTVNTVVRAVFLLLIVGCIALLRRAGRLKLRRLLETVLLMLLWFDVFTHAPNLSPTATCAVLQPDTVRRAFKWDNDLDAGVSRAMLPWATIWNLGMFGSENSETDTGVRRLSLFMNYNLLDHIAKVDGFYSSNLKEPFELFSHVYLKTNEAVQLKNFLGVSHITSPTNIVDWVCRNSFSPMITAGQRPVFANPDETLSILVSDQFEPLRTVYLPLEARGKIRASNPAHAEILSSQFSPQRVTIEVEADAPAMVVVAQAFYDAWHAEVDGNPTPLWRANYAFQALEIPSGRHQVSLVYQDRPFFWGTILSMIFLLICGGAWFGWDKVCWRGRFQKTTTGSSS